MKDGVFCLHLPPMASSSPHVERERLAMLHQLGLLDTPPEERFDRITRLAARIFDAPVSLVTLLGKDRQFFKSHYGWEFSETHRDVSFCAHMLKKARPLVVEDARHDARFASNPLVTGPPGIRAYLGIPIQSPEGLVLASHSVIDMQPRTFTEDDVSLLRELAGLVHHELERSRQAAKRADKSHHFIDRVLAALPGVLYIFDLDEQRNVFTNHFARKLLGYTAEDLKEMGADFLPSVMHPDDLGTPEEWVKRFATLGDDEILENEYRMRHQDGSWRWFYSHDCVFRRNSAGCPKQILGMAFDITTRKTHEKELLEAKEKAEEAARLKERILANVSHEIRTPLTAIIGFCEVIQEEAAPPIQQHMDIVLQSANRLRATLTSMLDVANLEAGSLDVCRESVDVVEVGREMIDLYAPVAESKQIGLEFHCETTPLYADADATALRRIVNNLLSNAIKFTEEGRIDLHIRYENDAVCLQVQDTGTGISEAFIPHLFDAFHQESTGDTRNYEGSGLGLSISQKLAELMGGEILVESTKGKGATFIVRLPAAS